VIYPKGALQIKNINNCIFCEKHPVNKKKICRHIVVMQEMTSVFNYVYANDSACEQCTHFLSRQLDSAGVTVIKNREWIGTEYEQFFNQIH
jgi:hypothetical protein